MKKLLNYLPFHFLLALILGIILQYNFKVWQFSILKLSTLLGVLFLIMIATHFYKKRIIFSGLSFCLFILIGIFSVFINTQINYDNHYSKLINENSFSIIKIDGILKENKYNQKYKGSVISVDNIKSRGNILLSIKNDSLNTPLKVGEQILLKSKFTEIQKPKNPYQFNYKNYLLKQNIHHQIFTKKDELILIDNKDFSFNKLIYYIRNRIQSSLKKYNFSNDEYAVINALLLGQKQDITTEIRENYANAGAIHILAISGLHIGILMLILSFILKPLETFKNGQIFKPILIVLLLWLFAFITGLSASVVRAVTMFSFITIGQHLQKENNIEFSLISSMLILLLIKPMFLFDIGFQLSYLCIFGIIWINPLFLKIWNPKSYFINKIWQLISVSLSVQIITLPISLYYFNQFAGLFLLSNLVIIPCLGLILIGGFITIILSILNILPQYFADIYGFIISILNNFVEWISNQKYFLFTDISISILEMISLYILISFGILFFSKRKTKYLIFLLVGILLFQSVSVYEKYKQSTKQEFIVFHKQKETILLERNSIKAEVYSKNNTLQVLDNYKIKENISLNFNIKIPNVLKFKNDTILIINKSNIYKLPELKNCIVLLTQSPKINLNKLILTLNPKQVIADGSNYKSYIKLWEETCKKQKTPFYSTEQNGAYILK